LVSLKHTNTNKAFQATNTIYNQLCNKVPQNKINSSGIYKIKCNTCNNSFVEQTGRKLEYDIGNTQDTLKQTTQFRLTLYTYWITDMNMETQTKP